MNTVIKKYGAGVASFIILVLTAISPITVWNLVSILQLVSLIASSILSVRVLDLLPGKWPGAFKTGVDLLGAAVALILPYAISGHITQSEIILVIVGVIKAAATEFGVIIRTDNVVQATGVGTSASPAVITSLVADPKAVAAGPQTRAPGPETPGTVSR